ncbi:TPA: hypothetical protein ACH3X2_008507 [Trebouxia sp. C0005]
MQGCQVASARRSQVWAEALDAWLQKLAQEIVHEHTSQALTPANVQASLELLLTKADIPEVWQTGHDIYGCQACSSSCSTIQAELCFSQAFPFWTPDTVGGPPD